MNHSFRDNINEALSHEMMRRVLEHEASDAEIQSMQRLLDVSDDARIEFEKMSHYLKALHALPQSSPPQRVWENITRRISRESPKRVWFPWLYANPKWGFIAKALPVMVLIAIVFGISNVYWAGSNYDVILVENINGYGQEIESYVIHHDLAGEPLPMRESFIAYYTNNGH